MANLEFYDKHNMVAFLKKPQGNESFHQILEFLNASHIKYALTENPTIYVSFINQFWRTASARTLDNGKIELNTTIDGQDKTITEASVMRHLNWEMLMGEGPTSPVETQHKPTIIETSPHLQNISNIYRKTKTRIRRMGIRIPQSNVPSSVADDNITKEMHDVLGRATTTASSLEAEQGSGNISKTQTKVTPSGPSSLRTSSEGGPGCHVTIRNSHVQARPERISNLPNEPPLEEGNTSLSGEGNMQLLELMDIDLIICHNENYLCNLCGNNSHDGYDCQQQFPFVHEQEPSYNQNYDAQNIDFSGSEQIQTPQYPEIQFSSQETSDEVFQANHSIQNEESFENYSSNQEKEEPLQESDIHQLIEEGSTEASEKQNMEDTMLELVKICQEKEFLCIHDDVDDLIESALNSKLLSINSQRLHIMEQPIERGNHSIQSMQNFRVVHKSSISFKNTSQISSIHAIAPVLSTKEPVHLLSMGYEHLSITPKTESDEVTESNVENLLPIPSKCEVALEDKKVCDVPISENSPVCNNHYDIFSNSKIDDDISVYDDDFEDIEYVEASLFDPEIVSVEEENVVQQEEEEVNCEDISQIQDIVLREKLLSIIRLISNIESLNDNSTPDRVHNSFESDNSLLDNFSPEFKTFCDHSEETRSGNTTHADNSLPEYDSFCFEIEPDQERLINLMKNDIPDNSINDPLLEEVDLFLFDDSIPPGIKNIADDPEGDIQPPDVETDTGEEISVVMNDKDEDVDYSSFIFVIFAKKFSLLSAESEDTIFDLEEPLSSSGTLSSMKNLDDAYNFGDYVFLGSTATTHEPIVTATTITTTTTRPLPPPPPQQNTSDSELASRVAALEQKLTAFEQKSKTLDNTTQNLRSRVFKLELRDQPYKIDQTLNTIVKEAVHIALQAPLRDRFRKLPEANINEIIHQ
nr:hypothetical protein [Tanacetum cinerariifolium]